MKFLAPSVLLSLLRWTLADMAKEETLEHLETCLDHKGKVVSHGDRFFPLGSDPCTQCTCLNGKPEMCIAVFCSPPENCRQYHALSDKCCEFVCLDRDFPNKASGNGTYPDLDTLSTTNLGLRLVASTVTSFLILALLLFMIHRLRQRRLLLMIRRFHARRMENGNSHLSRRYSEDDDGSVGYFVGHDQLDFSRYDEPPPPYTLWKPPEMYIPPGEAPPPYDLSVQLTAPYASNGRYAYNTGQVGVNQQAVISVHAENQPDVVTATTSSCASTNIEHHSNSVETTAEIEVNNVTNSNNSAVLPPDTQYEETCCYRTCCSQQEAPALQDGAEEAVAAAAEGTAVAGTSAGVSATCDDAVACTSTCTCSTLPKRGKSYKWHSCGEFPDQTRPRATVGNRSPDKRFSLNPSVSRENNNNLYPDPTAWGGEASESSSSSSPTYDQPTLSPSTSDSSSADTDFPRVSRIKNVLSNSIPCETAAMASSSRVNVAPQEPIYENARARDFGCVDDVSKPPHFQKTLSNLKKFSLIKRKKKKRRVSERPSEISCSFVCQSVATDNGMVFEEGLDLAGRGSDSRPLEAINPHIGHKLASSGKSRPTSIEVSSRLDDGAGPSYLSSFNGDSHVVTVTGRAAIIDVNCAACRNASSPETQADATNGISRSGSICSETGERRYHRSAGSSPAMPSRTMMHHSGAPRFDGRYASSSHINRTIHQRVDDSHVRHIPVWIVNSVAMPSSRLEYEHASTMPRSASANFREGSHSVGDITSPLDFRDSMLSSGSSWEACSHL